LYIDHYVCAALILAGVIGLAVAPADAANSGKSLSDDMNKDINQKQN